MFTRRYIGAPVKRNQIDPLVVTGQATYVDDITLPGMLQMQILRSPHAHARIKSVDTSEAEKLPGVVRVITGKDLVEWGYPMKRYCDSPLLKPAVAYPLAVDKVRFMGQGVAAVIAESRHAAKEALSLINVEYERLPAVVNAEKALEKNSPLLYEEWGDNIFLHFTHSEGDVEKAFKEADHVISDKVAINRYGSVAMETRGYIAQYDPATLKLTMWTSDQQLHPLRTVLAEILHIPETNIHIIQPSVGGGFGSKVPLYVESPLVCIASIKTGRCVKWIEERHENLMATGHAREQVDYFEAAVKEDGTVLAVKQKVIADVGPADAPCDGGVWQVYVNAFVTMPGPYRIRIYQTDAYALVTNKMGWNAHRGFGKAEANFVYERMMDIIAKRLGKDPSEVRLKNFIRPEEFPYVTATGTVFDSGNYAQALKKALEVIDYEGVRRQQVELWKQGRYLGVGVTFQIEPCASSIPDTYWMGYDGTTVKVDPTGKITVYTGITTHGSGNETTMAQVVADALGANIDDVAVVQGDTNSCPFGFGNYSSRSTIYGASSAVLAANDIKDKMLRMAGQMLDAAPESLEAYDSKIFVKGDESRSVTFGDVAKSMFIKPFAMMPPGVEPGLHVTRYWMFPGDSVRHTPDDKGGVRTYPCFPNAANAAIVEADVETGEVRILRCAVIHDCGSVINPMIVEGQVHGGIAHGIGGAMYESYVYNENGQMLTTTLMDYMLPTAKEVPNIEVHHQETPSPFTILGSKGCGEGGAIGVAACLASAVEDALKPFNVAVRETPLTPSNVWQLLKQAKEKQSAAR
ncbi:MAG: xanthine dehydrogenase family protein molybdopterin-binding subunit [Candidatus Bathyarchaeia archaeon]